MPEKHIDLMMMTKATADDDDVDDDDDDDDDDDELALARQAWTRPCSSTTRRPSCRRTGCPAGQLEAAKATCTEREHKFIPSMACLIDVCFGGKGFAAEG